LPVHRKRLVWHAGHIAYQSATLKDKQQSQEEETGMTPPFKVQPRGRYERDHEIDAEQGSPADGQYTEHDGEASENHKRQPRDDFKKDLDAHEYTRSSRSR
jgi:hypothetical protein